MPGNVSLRPFIQFEGQSVVTGQWLSAFSRGVLFITAAKWFDQSTIMGREEVLWDHESDEVDTAFGSGSIGSFWFDLPISPGEPLIVSIGIRVTGNQSGDEYMGWSLSFRSWSYFTSTLSAKLPFMVAKLN